MNIIKSTPGFALKTIILADTKKDQPSGWSFFQKYDFLKNYIVKNHNNTAYFNKYF